MTDNATPAEPPLESLTTEELLTEWHKAEAAKSYWAPREMLLRQLIFSRSFPDPVRGTNKVKIGHGMALVATHKISVNISDKAGLEAARSLILPETFDKVVNYSPFIKDGAYFALPDDDRKAFAPFVTEKPAAPSIELRPADKVRW